jgi:ribosome-associated protein
VESIIDKKGNDVLLLDVKEQCIFADYFVLCNADNLRQVNAIANGVRQAAKEEAGRTPGGSEGNPQGGWMLIDYGEVMVHVFEESRRAYYKLEDLWQEAHTVLRMQ